MIRVLIAEDQALVLGALGALLRLEPDLEVVGQARDGREALALCGTLRPDIVLTDIEMPLMTGLELATALHEQQLPAKVIIVTTFARTGYLRRALADAAALRQGNGLVGMGERVAAIGGKLALTVERGLALELRLPLGAPA